MDLEISEIRDVLNPMLNKQYVYGGIVHTIKKYDIHIERGRVEIVTDQRNMDRPFDSVIGFLSMFKPVIGTGAPLLNKYSPVDKRVARPGHELSDVNVYITSDYSRFIKILGNRNLVEKKIKDIISDIRAGIDVLKYYPIDVFETPDGLEIIDGQHRFAIAKKLGMPVHYIIMEKAIELPEVAKINSNTSKWKPADFLNCFIEQGNEHYKTLKAFIERYGFSVTTSIKLLSKGNPGSEEGLLHLSSDFQRGLFQASCATEAAVFADEVKRYSFFPHYKERGFIIAIYRIREAGLVNMDELHEKVSKHSDLLRRVSGYKENVLQLEVIFNHGRSKRQIIFQ